MGPSSQSKRLHLCGISPATSSRLIKVSRLRVAVSVLAGLALLVGTASRGHADVYINKDYPIQGRDGVPELSPPHIEATNECSSHVYVDSFVPKATVRVYLGTTLIGSATPQTGFTAIALTHQLHIGDKVTATQTVNGITSKPSADATIGAMPAVLPEPTIDPKIYACGRVVPVHGLVSGVTVDVKDVTANSTIGTGFTPNAWGSDWSPVGTTALTATHKITATQTACGTKTSAPSAPATVLHDPAPMTKPTVEKPVVGDDTITVNGLYTGADVEAQNTAVTPPANLAGGFATGAGNWLELPTPVTATEDIAVTETLCSDKTTSEPVKPVATLTAPLLLGPICPGQTAVEVRDSTLNATLVLLKNNVVVGYGGAAPGDVPLTIAPPNAFALNDTVQVLQYINAITSPKSNTVKVGCTNVQTYHYNSQRTGWNDTEQTLTPANVGSPEFRLLQTVPLDDQVDGQPLVVTQQTIKNLGKRDVVYVATENNTVYAIDTQTGDILLSPNFGTPVPQSALPGNCGNNANHVGINSTPVIDVAAGIMYVVTYTYESSAPVFRIHALSLEDLTDKVPPVVITASHKLSDGSAYAFLPHNARQRAALLEADGNVYAGFASFCDIEANLSRGWLLGWKTGTLAPLAANELTITQTEAQTPPSSAPFHNFYLSSIWMSGYGIAADPGGDLYFVTGNSNTVRTDNIQESAVRMSSDLTTVKQFFTPFDVVPLDQGDLDFGSGGLLVLPDQRGSQSHLAVAAGKAGKLFILDRDNMGGFVSGGPDKPKSVDIQWCHCGPSYFGGSDGVGRVVSSGGTQVNTWKVEPSAAVALTSEAKSESIFTSQQENNTKGIQDSGFFTTISSNGTQPNTAVIWAVSRPDVASSGTVSLYAFNAAATAGTLPKLFSGVAGTWPNVNGNANIVPVAANAKVYVASFKQLAIFGLAPPPLKMVRLTQEARALEAPAAAPPPEVTGTRVFGTIASISGNALVVRLRTGETINVDLTAAQAAYRTVVPVVGEPVAVIGTVGPDGTLQAQSMLRTKGPASWGPDQR